MYYCNTNFKNNVRHHIMDAVSLQLKPCVPLPFLLLPITVQVLGLVRHDCSDALIPAERWLEGDELL